MKRWRDEYNDKAAHEGWNLFTCDGGEHDGKIRILRISDMSQYDWYPDDGDGKPLFRDDEAAIAFVRARAKQGERHAMVAMSMHNTRARKVKR